MPAVPMDLSTAFLADHPQTLPIFEAWFKAEWPEHYGPNGSGDARQDLLQYATRDTLPVGLVGFVGEEPVALAVLTHSADRARPDLSPWVAAGLVHPEHRDRGFGNRLLSALEQVAEEMGYAHIFCGTQAAALLLERSGWAYVEHSEADGRHLAIYKKTLRPKHLDSQPLGL